MFNCENPSWPVVDVLLVLPLADMISLFSNRNSILLEMLTTPMVIEEDIESIAWPLSFCDAQIATLDD